MTSAVVDAGDLGTLDGDQHDYCGHAGGIACWDWRRRTGCRQTTGRKTLRLSFARALLRNKACGPAGQGRPPSASQGETSASRQSASSALLPSRRSSHAAIRYESRGAECAGSLVICFRVPSFGLASTYVLVYSSSCRCVLLLLLLLASMENTAAEMPIDPETRIHSTCLRIASGSAWMR